MKIDTLIFSGGSTKGIAFLGSFKYLVENNYINYELTGIKKIICVSASYVFVLMLVLLNCDYEYMENETLKFNFENFLNINDISLKNLIDDYGFINYNHNHVYIKNVLKDTYNVDKMSLLKLYKLTNIHIIVKVVNVSKQRIEYMDHINNPKMNILKLLQMTTAIPILLKPIKYKGDLYLDGRLSGNCPIEINDSDNYLCIDIKSENKIEINNVLDYIQCGWKMYSPDILTRQYNKNNIKIDLSELNISFAKFNLDMDTKKKILEKGYEDTKNHFSNPQYF